MSKKEPNSWDRFWLYVKENEKIIWVLLLLILAPSFAFTGYFSTWMTSSTRKSAVATIAGKSVSRDEFDQARVGLFLVQEVAPEYLSQRQERLFGTDFSGVIDYLILLREADRLGIRVSDYELGSQVRSIYRVILAKEDAQKAVQEYQMSLLKDGKKANTSMSALQNQYYQVLSARMRELEKRDEFNGDDWYAKLQSWRSSTRTGPIPREDFENALREVMKAKKLENFMRMTVQVTPDEALEEYKKKEQSRKFSFFEVNAAPAKEEVEKSITDADISARYEKRKEDFKEDLKLRVGYLSVPVAEFEKKVTLTDEDLLKEYERVKMQKYQTLVGEGGGFELLPPEEKAERDKARFRPFEQVKEEIRTELTKVRVREAARKAAEEVQEKLFPRKPGAIGEKKEEKPEPTPATFEEIAKQFPMVKTGTTPWVDRKSAEKAMGPEAWTPTVGSWFAQLEPGPMNKSPKKEVDPPKMYTSANFSDPQYFVFFKKPEVRQPGVPPLPEVKEKVKEALVKEKLFDRAKEKTKALAEEIRGGKKTFEDAAKEAGSTVIASGFVERADQGGTIKVPLSPEELKKAEAERAEKKDVPADESKAPKEKDFPGSKAVLEFGFDSIREKGRVEGFAEDPENSACYVVRWDDTIFPDLKDFDKRRNRYEYSLLREKQEVYLADWWTKVRTGANPQSVFYGEKRGENIPVPDPYAE